MVRVPSSVTKIMKCDDGSRHVLCHVSVGELTRSEQRNTEWRSLRIAPAVGTFSMDVKFQLMPFTMAVVWAEKCLYRMRLARNV